MDIDILYEMKYLSVSRSLKRIERRLCKMKFKRSYNQIELRDSSSESHCVLTFIFCPIFYPWSCWTRLCPAFANSVDPNWLASSEAKWSGSALFVIDYVKFVFTT